MADFDSELLFTGAGLPLETSPDAIESGASSFVGGAVDTAPPIYLMRAQDVDCVGIVYREWLAIGTPDFTASLYAGARCGATPLAEITASKLTS